MLFPFLTGLFLGGSLIIAIGAQNAYILRMGLLRQHVFWLCLFCAVSDAMLIVLGVAGLGAIVEAQPSLLRIIALAGAVFLGCYSFIAFRRALNPGILTAANTTKPTLSAAIAVCATFTWLNPHVYLDTVVLVGAYSTRFEEAARIAFGAGAVSASFLWFFGLGYGARLLEPYFARPTSWRILDGGIGVVMALLSVSLLKEALGL